VAKRINIDEILERKQRLFRRLPRWKQTSRRLLPIMDTLKYIAQRRGIEPKYRGEVMRYFPVAMVACIEGYFRLVVRDLVNAGHPFRERVASLEKMEIGIESLLAIADRQLTPGDIVSHFLPFNNLGDIQRNMSKLLECDFLNEVKTWKVASGGKNPPIVLGKLQPPVVPLLERLYELRHIYCHELAVKRGVPSRKVADSTRAGFLLTYATEDYIREVHLPKK